MLLCRGEEEKVVSNAGGKKERRRDSVFIFLGFGGKRGKREKRTKGFWGEGGGEMGFFLFPPLFLAIYYAAPSASAAAVPFKWSGILFLAIFKRDPGMFSPLYPPPDPFLCIASISDKSAQKEKETTTGVGTEIRQFAVGINLEITEKDIFRKVCGRN